MVGKQTVEIGRRILRECLLHHQIERCRPHRREQFVLLDLDPITHARASERIDRLQGRFGKTVVEKFVDDGQFRNELRRQPSVGTTAFLLTAR